VKLRIVLLIACYLMLCSRLKTS